MAKTQSKKKETKPSFWQGLMEFLKKYSVIGLAIGVVTGQASKDLVDAIVKGVFTPLIKLVAPESFNNLTFSLGSQTFDIGIVINAALTFIIIMTFLYFIVKIIIKNDELLEKK